MKHLTALPVAQVPALPASTFNLDRLLRDGAIGPGLWLDGMTRERGGSLPVLSPSPPRRPAASTRPAAAPHPVFHRL